MVKTKKGMTRAQKSQAIWGLAFVAPTIIGLIVLNFYPILYTVYQSFCKTGDFGMGNTFVGLSNYVDVLTSGEFFSSLLNTFKYAIVEVPLSVAIALVLAVFLNRKIAFRGGYRTIFFLPMVAAPAAVAMVWKFLYNQRFGLLNHLFGTDISWISDPKIAWISIGIIGVWSIVGYNMILFISGLQEIPHDYYEAADIDGATGIPFPALPCISYANRLKPSFRMFFAALISLSCTAPHSGHVHSLTDKSFVPGH